MFHIATYEKVTHSLIVLVRLLCMAHVTRLLRTTMDSKSELAFHPPFHFHFET